MKNLQRPSSDRPAASNQSGNGHNGNTLSRRVSERAPARSDADERRSVKNGRSSNGSPLNGHALAYDQARELTSLFVSLTRQLLVVDDFIAEMPLRQLRVCMVLYDGPRSMSALSRELGVSLSAMTQIADRLERARLVKRSFEGSDRRVRCLQLTPRGQKIMQLREEVRIQRAQSVVEQMSESTRDQVIQSMRSLLSATQRVTASDPHAERGNQNGYS